MSFLNVGSATQFVATAACNFSLKKAKVEQGPVLCSVLAPAVQAAGNYVYQKTVKPTPEATATLGSSSLSPPEEAIAGTIGAYAGYGVLKKTGDALYEFLQDKDKYSAALTVLDVQTSSFVRAGVAVMGTQAVSYLANAVKKTYFSPDSSFTAEKAPKVQTTA